MSELLEKLEAQAAASPTTANTSAARNENVSPTEVTLLIPDNQVSSMLKRLAKRCASPSVPQGDIDLIAKIVRHDPISDPAEFQKLADAVATHCP